MLSCAGFRQNWRLLCSCGTPQVLREGHGVHAMDLVWTGLRLAWNGLHLAWNGVL